MRLSGLLLACVAAMWPQLAMASTEEDAQVRTGTTIVREAGAAADPGSVVESRPEAPGDAPRSHAGTLRLPDVPAGFNTYKGGWITFVYHPSIRERVSQGEWQMRVDLAAAYQLAHLYKWTDLIYTHFSGRVPGTEDFLINPYGMMRKSSVSGTRPEKWV